MFSSDLTENYGAWLTLGFTEIGSHHNGVKPQDIGKN